MRMKFLRSISILISCTVVCISSIHAQTFLGAHVSQYDALKMVYFNPGALPNSEMRWQVNVLSFDITAANNAVKMNSLKGIVRDFDQNKFFTVIQDGKKKNIHVNTDVRGPGFFFAFGKNAISFGTRARAIASINDLDEDLAYSLFHYQNNLLDYIPNIQNSNVSGAANAFLEYSASYARKIIDKKAHSISVGVNVKVLDKIFYSSFVGENIQYNKYQTALDSVVNVHDSKFDMVLSDDLEHGDFKYKMGIDGFAIDAGVEYSYSPSRLLGKHFLRAGISLNDMGTLRQKYGASSIHFEGNGRDIPASHLTDSEGELLHMNEVLDSLGTRTVLEGTIKSKLPTALNVYADVRIFKALYVFGGLQINPYDLKKYKNAVANIPTNFTIIPRFEIKKVGVFLPIGWNKYDQFTTGAGVRLGQFSLGSSNIITAISKKNFTGVNMYLSLSFGGKRRVDKI